MRRYQKQTARQCIQTLNQAHTAIKKSIENKNMAGTLELLPQCQDAAIQLGTMIEETEGEGYVTVRLLEDYCELVFQIYTLAAQNHPLNPGKVHKQLKKQMIQIENSINETPERLEVVFLPYKASMWDSLESVWMAAEADENCDAYVIPIPYYDRTEKLDFGEMHYEKDMFPDYVPVTSYEAYDFAGRRPDAIFIHNPYDGYNYLTSVHPFFYSSNLKQFTDSLVYIPYYSTSGGMSDAQAQCAAYYHVDYIIMQAEKYRKFFDPELPREKLLPLGSPKFDRIIRICKNPPEPPEDWKRKMDGRKVYFYNTSIGGALGNTEAFLKKVEYVFRCFQGREDACLLWRPHPLLDSTFESMRPGYKAVYEGLKTYFLENDLGIYDDTPDIANTIALSDVYIGDSGTSVTSLFGIVGKPMFILNNDIHSAPEGEDWRGWAIRVIPNVELNSWMVTQGNKLYYAPAGSGKYKYLCDLCRYAYGGYYSSVIEIGGKAYVCPVNGQDIVVVGEKGIEKRIPLEPYVEQMSAFYGAVFYENYLFLLPNFYPAMVRYDTVSGQVKYITDNLEVFRGIVNGERRCGGACVMGDKVYVVSPEDNRVLETDAVTCEQRVLTIDQKTPGTYMGVATDNTDLWILPFNGTAVTRWNPKTGETREYMGYPEGMECVHYQYKCECQERPFGSMVFYEDYVYLAPFFGNMYIRLDKNTGEATEWKPPMKLPKEETNGYFASWAKGYFTFTEDEAGKKRYHLFSCYDKKYYDIDFESGGFKEVEIEFDLDELQSHEPGFRESDQWLQYSCQENVFNSLPDFLDGNVMGEAFDRERQVRAYREIAANNDGTCGEKIYHMVRQKVDS